MSKRLFKQTGSLSVHIVQFTPFKNRAVTTFKNRAVTTILKSGGVQLEHYGSNESVDQKDKSDDGAKESLGKIPIHRGSQTPLVRSIKSGHSYTMLCFSIVSWCQTKYSPPLLLFPV
nr:hypothetical protein BgiMline_032558 [Biomphalaria glabrata]